MLVNSVTAITRVAPHLKRSCLSPGTKYYGVHLGPLRERQCGRLIPPCATQLLLLIRLTCSRLSSEERVDCGTPPSDPVVASRQARQWHPSGNRGLRCDIERTPVCRCFSGKTWRLRHDLPVTESTHFAKVRRCGLPRISESKSSLQYYQRRLFPMAEPLAQGIAEVFQMSLADPQTISLTQHMADKGPLWEGK
jgi:hypothetical protein